MKSLAPLVLMASLALGLGVACGDDSEGLSSSGTGGTTATGGSGAGSTGASSTGASASGGSGASNTGGMVASGGTGGTGGPVDYPAGPYGNEVGDIFPFLTWQGYLSTDPVALATTETWTDTYTSLDLHQSGAGYAVVHTTLST